MNTNKHRFFCAFRGYNNFKTMGKVGVAVILSLTTGGFVYHAYQPRLVCDESSVVMNAIPIKKDQTFYEHTYKIYNRSLQTITLDGVKSSCNCQSVTVSDPIIPPHAEGTVIARFTVARNAAGVRHADFLVFANNRPDPMLRLQMAYSFELGVWTYPEQINLGRIVSGEPVEFSIQVRQEKVTDRKRTSVESAAAEGIALEVLPRQCDVAPEKATSGDAVLVEQNIIGRFVNDFKAGYHDRTVTIHTDHPDYPILSVPVRWESVAELNFTPTTLHFGIMETASTSSRIITLISESEPIRVLQAKISGDGFRLESQNQTTANRVDFLIEACAGTVPGVYKGQLAIQLSKGKECQAGLIFIVE